VTCTDVLLWTCCLLFASRGPGVRIPLAPPGQRHNSKSWAPGIGAGTAAKYSNGDRTRCRTRVRTGPLPRRQGLRIPGPEPSFGAAEQEECSSFPSCVTCPVVGVRRTGSAVSRLTLAADAGGQSGLALPAAARIAPVLMDQMGASVRSRPARRRPEFTARAAAPVRAAASSSSGRACCAPWRTPVRRGCSARRADRSMAGALVQPDQVPGCRGRRAAAGAAGSGRDRPAGTGRVAAGLLADGLQVSDAQPLLIT
jgi:hypothetical protein